MSAYYNEFDPGKAAWLRALMARGLIAPGEVDERSIVDVQPEDLRGFTQCHFFAGIGIWSYALRLAGWPDDRPVWTGSCPCQPFSAAGKKLGREDPRHLAPAWLGLIAEQRPERLFGEQVGDAVREGWLDDLQDELENRGYAVGSSTFPACGVGAPHIRQRLYFGAIRLADDDARLEGRRRMLERADQRLAGPGSLVGGLADADQQAGGGRRVFGPKQGDGACFGAARERSARLCTDGGLALPDGRERGGVAEHDDVLGQRAAGGRVEGDGQPAGAGGLGDPGPTNGFWGDADWLYCRDGKWRPVEPGAFPLADGSPARVLRLRGYGDGIVAPQAAAFIRAFEEAAQETLAAERVRLMSVLTTDGAGVFG